MSVMTKVKEKINAVAFEQRSHYKYLWAELERAGLAKKLSEADEYKVIEKLIADNEDTISNFTKLGRDSDPRVVDIKAQNSVLREFLPDYICKEKLLVFLTEKNMTELVGSKNGKSIGLITKALKDNNINFQNELVKEIVFA